MKDLSNNFKYHEPTEDKLPVYKEIRARFEALANFIESSVPDSREKSVAQTNLETAMFWANAGVARNG